MKKAYYFAYGRNMLGAALRWRVGHVKKLGTYTMHGMRLVFNTGTYWAYANIEEGNADDKVEGVLYELSSLQERELDKYEGYPTNYQKRYFNTQNGLIIFAYVSTKKFMKTKLPALRSYIMDLYNGAKENNLTDTKAFLKSYLADVLKEPLKPKIKKNEIFRLRDSEEGSRQSPNSGECDFPR